MIVAGDIGGTKTYLGLFDWQETRVAPIREAEILECGLRVVRGNPRRIFTAPRPR